VVLPFYAQSGSTVPVTIDRRESYEETRFWVEKKKPIELDVFGFKFYTFYNFIYFRFSSKENVDNQFFINKHDSKCVKILFFITISNWLFYCLMLIYKIKKNSDIDNRIVNTLNLKSFFVTNFSFCEIYFCSKSFWFDPLKNSLTCKL
jgi:hypothetical protein